MARIVITILLYLSSFGLNAQTTNEQNKETIRVPEKYLDKISSQSKTIEQKLDKKTKKALAQLQKQEARMKKKLEKTDSVAAENIFADAENKYKELEQRLKNSSFKQYIPGLDTISTSLKLLEQNPELLKQTKETKEKLADAMNKVKGLETQIQKAEDLKQFLKERKEFLKQQLSKLGFAKELKKLNKQVYYYSQQLNEYKAILNDPKKIERKAIELLSKTKLFKDYMQKNSMLASLFRIPGDPNDPDYTASLAGLQTRAQVNSLLQQQIGSAGLQQFRQQMQDAKSQIDKIKNGMLKAGESSSDDIVPEKFKPNNQKTKTFLQRIELGTNIQSQKSTNFFPVTSDIGLSVGYKLNDHSLLGIGASYKMGWGRGWNNLDITHQGVSLRSFIDWKIKGSLYISGGYEQNYKPLLRSLNIPSPVGGSWMGAEWQQSGLVGLSKVVSVKSKLFKKTKLQLLWDFLSYEQRPRTQTIVFRVGYNIK